MTDFLAIAERWGAWAALALVLGAWILRERMQDRAALTAAHDAHMADLRAQLPATQASTAAVDAVRVALDAHGDRIERVEAELRRLTEHVGRGTDPDPAPPSRRGR